MIAEMLKNQIKTALANLGISEASFVLEHPTDLEHGDYATNVAMVTAKILDKNPREVAEIIVQKLQDPGIRQDDSKKFISSIEIAGPGFINIKLAPEFFHDVMADILNQEESFGKLEIYTGKKVLVEHSSPNLFKPFHIGHMMNNTIGESLTRLMRNSGAEVRTMSFPSDISLGVAKALFVILEKYGTDFEPADISVLGDAYVEGTQWYDNDESIHARVKEIADNVYGQNESPEWIVFQKCKAYNINYFESIVARLGSHFDSYIYESEAGETGKEIVLSHIPGVFTKSEGAIVYIPDESKKNLNTAVFINSQGNPTYEAKDIGLLAMKFERENPDLSIFITDSEQVPHFNIVLDAAQYINKDWSEKSKHVYHGRMAFKGKKMSSRLGGVPLVTEMIDVVSQDVVARSERNTNPHMTEDIAIAAIKFSILRTKPGQNINFDPETSLSFEGDSGPYLQYTHARISSLLEKGRENGIEANYSNDVEITDVEKILYRFPEIVESAIIEYAPQHVVVYLLQVAQAFNSYYGANKIIDLENLEVSSHRLAIARATQIVLKNGLELLGIVAPEKM